MEAKSELCKLCELQEANRILKDRVAALKHNCEAKQAMNDNQFQAALKLLEEMQQLKKEHD